MKESCVEDKGRGREHRQKWQILEVKYLLGRGSQTGQVIGYLESHLLKWSAVFEYYFISLSDACL